MLSLAAAMAWGCDEKEAVEANPAVDAAQPEPAAAEQQQQPSETNPESEADEESAERRAAEEKAQAEVEANPLTDCCRALGKQAFTLRSPEYHGASKACGEAMTEKKELASVIGEIKKSLKDKPLPSECNPK